MSGEEITINCSPGTFQKAQQDPEFLSALVNSAQEQSGQIVCSIAEQSSTDILDSIIEGENVEDEVVPFGEEKSIWVDAAVKLLLSLVADLRPKVGKCSSLRNKVQMWKSIQSELNSKGYSFTAQQIENKYRGLERTFKKAKCHNNKSGRNRESCPYEKELSTILNERPSVFPSCLIGTARDDILTRKDLIAAGEGCSSNMDITTGSLDVEASGSSIDKEADVSNLSSGTTQSSKRKSKHQEILETLNLMREERREQHESLMAALKEGNEKREALMKERNEILRSVAESLKK